MVLPVMSFQPCWRFIRSHQRSKRPFTLSTQSWISVSPMYHEMLKGLSALITAESILVLGSDHLVHHHECKATYKSHNDNFNA